jgi:oxygen-independent coproporphyrinogen-3 oxidase
MTINREFPLYEYWADYPERDKEYVRWYPPTLNRVNSCQILDGIASGPDELAFYLHVPFCKDICPYCPFNKYSLREERKNAFVDGILKEIGIIADKMSERGTRVMSGYFGGGTPTALATADLTRIIRACFEQFDIAAGAEITVEANPDTIDVEKLQAIRAAGVNRISFGVQSFDDRFLNVLGRTHTGEGAYRAVAAARQAGFDNIAIDLMYRVPGQSTDDWARDLRTAVDLGVSHISTYCLFLDPGTRLYNQTLAGSVAGYPDEDTEWAMYDCTQEILGGAGFLHYTINDFSQPGRMSEHHLVNWQAPQRSYLGMGPGAFGHLEKAGGGLIYCTIHSLQEYVAALQQGELPVRLGQDFGLAEQQARYMVLGLRCLEVKKRPFRELFHVEMDDAFGPAIRKLSGLGLLTDDEEKVRMTGLGRHFASNVLKAFYTTPNHRMPQPIGVELLAGRGASMLSIQPS